MQDWAALLRPNTVITNTHNSRWWRTLSNGLEVDASEAYHPAHLEIPLSRLVVDVGGFNIYEVLVCVDCQLYGAFPTFPTPTNVL
jgi:hypothetical protein